jgi:hypothetical protein
MFWHDAPGVKGTPAVDGQSAENFDCRICQLRMQMEPGMPLMSCHGQQEGMIASVDPARKPDFLSRRKTVHNESRSA